MYEYHRNDHIRDCNAAPAYRVWLFDVQINDKTKARIFIIRR